MNPWLPAWHIRHDFADAVFMWNFSRRSFLTLPCE